MKTIHRRFVLASLVGAICGLSNTVTHGQWVTMVKESSTRMVSDPAIGLADTRAKNYCWGDLNNNGWVDLVVMRKPPFGTTSKERNVLFMNENGVLVDRTLEYASAVAQHQLPIGTVDDGFLTPTCDTDCKVYDLTANGWNDVVTASGFADGSPKHIGHPRVYANLTNNARGDWLGLRFENDRIPTMCSLQKVCPPTANPRFFAVAAGDVTNNGFADLYFGDQDKGDTGALPPPAAHDYDNRLLINDGSGHFADESLLRMGGLFNYSNHGVDTYLWSFFSSSVAIADLNGNNLNDVVKLNTVIGDKHVAVVYNNPNQPGFFSPPPPQDDGIGYQKFHQNEPYFVSLGDLNKNGNLDAVLVDDFTDRVRFNNGTDADGRIIWSPAQLLPDQTSVGGGNRSLIVDLNNDTWLDIIVTDVNAIQGPCATTKRLQFHRNNANPTFPGAPVTFTNVSNHTIPSADRQGVWSVAAFDLTGNGWIDLVLGRCGTGGLPGTDIWINDVPVPACVADINGDDVVNGLDLLELLGAWGPNAGHPADINGDDVVNGLDLLELLAAWGPCP